MLLGYTITYSISRSEILGSFLNLVLEQGLEISWNDRVINEDVSESRKGISYTQKNKNKSS